MQSTLGISPTGDYSLKTPALDDYSKRTTDQSSPEDWGISEGRAESYRGYREKTTDNQLKIEESNERTKNQTADEWQPSEKSEETRQKQEQKGEGEHEDVYQQMLDRLEELRKRTREVKEDIPEQSEKSDKHSESADKKSRTNQEDKENITVPGTGNTKALDEMTTEEINTEAKGILGEHKSFASYADSRFNRYMSLAEKRLEDGKFYLAADSYTMAISYKKDDPLPYAGKCHALFAAGEYMSSALFLSRTLEMFPEYPLFNVDIVNMLGGRDIIETRIADIKDWIRVAPGDVPELHFLLAYIYHQIDRNKAATEQIEQAHELEPDNKTIQILYDIINPA
jgi:tetratricopeptide (TPR) repeat protein